MSHITAEQVRDALKSITDPDSGTDIVSRGMISEIAIHGRKVSFAIMIDADGGERMEPVRKMAEDIVSKISGVAQAHVALTAERAPTMPNADARKLDKYKMDGNKMLWHMERVQAWKNGERVAPLHIDAGLSKGCNIRCQYCYGVTQGNFFKKGSERVFPRDALLQYMQDCGDLGVRSIALIGEAEPTLNPAVYEAIATGKKAGVDMSMGTNGVLFDTTKVGEEALEHLTWLRFNISAGSDYAYRRVHASKEFNTVVEKIRFAVETKRKLNLDTTVGLQMVLTPQNVDQAVPLAQLGAELEVDYLVIKQCSDTQEGDIGVYDQLEVYHDFGETLHQAETFSNPNYNVIVKWDKITNEGHREYDNCLGAPFLLYSSGDGKLYPCGQWFDHREEEFRLADLTKMTFKQAIESDAYWDMINKQACHVDVHKECYSNCRTHSINDFLWNFSHPPQHVNFV